MLTISKSTELGKITISNVIFAEIIDEGFRLEKCAGKIWPATKRGRQIGNDLKYSVTDLANNIEVAKGLNSEGIDIEFSTIIKFGAGISSVTDTLCDYIVDTMKDRHNKSVNTIKVRITGIKSKQIARRDLEVIKRYETER